jgi:hypothetical protein
VKAWKVDDPSAPKFPKDFEIVKKVVLQVTDIKTNHNKYYALELHQGKGGTEAGEFRGHGMVQAATANPWTTGCACCRSNKRYSQHAGVRVRLCHAACTVCGRVPGQNCFAGFVSNA